MLMFKKNCSFVVQQLTIRNLYTTIPDLSLKSYRDLTKYDFFQITQGKQETAHEKLPAQINNVPFSVELFCL